MKNKKLSTVVIAVLSIALMFVMAACSSGKYEEDYTDSTVPDSTENYVAEDLNRKIFYYVNLDIESEKPTEIGAKIKTEAKAKGGFIENSREMITGEETYLSYTVRIPTENLDEFLSTIEESGGCVTSKTLDAIDITTKYVTAQATVNALNNEKESLTRIMENASSVSDILAITDRISEINARLETFELELYAYDNLVKYSTILVTIVQPQKTSIAAIVVPIVIGAVIIAIIVILVINRKRKKRFENEQ